MVRTLAGKHPSYYEAILQLRDASPEAKTFAEREIRQSGIPVAKIAKVKNGYDYYLADSKFAKALGKKLWQQFGGERIVTASLVTQKDGRDIYRLTVLFRGAAFRKGDIVSYQGEEHIIRGMGRDILLQSTKTGRKAHLKFREMSRIRKKG